jgi:hypothetical protein
VSASRSVVPSASFASSHDGSKLPPIALLPDSVTPKRTPSSSPNATTSYVYGSRLPRADRSRTHAIAVRMPNSPS